MSELKKLAGLACSVARSPRLGLRLLGQLPWVMRGFAYGRDYRNQDATPAAADGSRNPLREFFDRRQSGRGIWKWLHYFDIYHRHLAKFIGQETHVMEIGVYSGGSLEMWRDYFGARCQVYGVDLQAACKAYENEYTKIFVGDQADRE